MERFGRSVILKRQGVLSAERKAILSSVQKAVLEPSPSLEEAKGSTFLHTCEILIHGPFRLWLEFPTVCQLKGSFP